MSKTILIVDDEDMNLEMIEAVLHSAGYTVLKAKSSKEAIAIIEQERTLSAILMDLIMPGADGFAAIKTIKGMKPMARLIPIMALTASNDKDSVLKAISCGADEYLTKPFDPDDLLLRVTGLCKISDFNKRWGAIAK